MPAAPPTITSPKISTYTLASLDSFFYQDHILTASQKKGLAPSLYISRLTDLSPVTPKTWDLEWSSLDRKTQDAINTVFRNFGRAVAQYEQGIIAIDSPFDRFARLFLKSQKPEESFSKDFGAQEFHGLQLFASSGNCTTCHSGPNFTDQQFHNIGLPLENIKTDFQSIDAGRSTGVLQAKNSPFKCLSAFSRESCLELPWLDSENLELVGAFKTPSLRNVAERKPYAHDGRFKDLMEILKYYNELADEPGIGHREETLVALNYSEKELAALMAFLKSLSSPISELHEQP